MTALDHHHNRIVISANGVVIPASLNGTCADQEFMKRLPLTVTVERGEFDYCGEAGPLDFEKSETQAGWVNGDIGYSRGWFALFFGGEEQSKSFKDEMIIGQIDEGCLSSVRKLGSSVRLTIEVAPR